MANFNRDLKYFFLLLLYNFFSPTFPKNTMYEKRMLRIISSIKRLDRKCLFDEKEKLGNKK